MEDASWRGDGLNAEWSRKVKPWSRLCLNHMDAISLYITCCCLKFPLFSTSVCISLQSVILGSSPGLGEELQLERHAASLFHPAAASSISACPKMILASPNHKQVCSPLSLLNKKNILFSCFSFFFFFICVKYSWQPLLFNCLLLPQPTAMHFIPNSAFYFQPSEQWDENFALKMCSEESGCHMCVEILRACRQPPE